MSETDLPRLVDVGETRATLHQLAENVLVAEQHAANHELALASVSDGFATGWFPAPAGGLQRVSVIGNELVRETPAGEQRQAIDGELDLEAARVLYAWWSLGDAVLSGLRAGEGESISPVILWPEHFDIAVTLTTADARSMNLGFSPGDEFCEVPYIYAGPWQPPVGEFWNAPFGAFRRYHEVAPEDPFRVAATFLAEARQVFGELEN